MRTSNWKRVRYAKYVKKKKKLVVLYTPVTKKHISLTLYHVAWMIIENSNNIQLTQLNITHNVS